MPPWKPVRPQGSGGAALDGDVPKVETERFFDTIKRDVYACSPPAKEGWDIEFG